MDALQRPSKSPHNILADSVCLVIAAVFIVAASNVFCANTRTKFTALDITSGGDALFAVSDSRHEQSSAGAGGVLFAVNVPDIQKGKTLSAPFNLLPLTCYPDEMFVLCDGRIQVLSNYAAAIYDTNTSALLASPIDDVISMRPLMAAASPDGKWICFVQRKRKSTLILRNTITGKEYTLDYLPAISASIPIKWSPDSTFFVYSSRGKIYFCDPDAVSMGVQIDEHYRYICQGTTESVCYTSGLSFAPSKSAALFYAEGNTINVIEQNGIYTQSIYSDILGHGKPCGRLPYSFDPLRDKFSVRPDGKAVAVLKDGSLFSVYEIGKEGSPMLEAACVLQVPSSSWALIDSQIMWGNDKALLKVNFQPWDGWDISGGSDTAGRGKTVVYFASCDGKSGALMAEYGDFHCIVSPNGKRAAFFDNSAIRVYDTSKWSEEGKYSTDGMICAVWDGNYAMYLGTQSTVSRWIVGDNNAEALFPVSSAKAAWKDSGASGENMEAGNTVSRKESQKMHGSTVIASCPNGASFEGTILPSGIYWQRCTQKNITPSLQNGQYRLFCSSSPNPHFENALYVRCLKNNDGKKKSLPATMPICKSSAEKPPRKKQIALVIDAYNSADYLAQVLCALKANDVKGSFFINGAFIARYPEETRCIANSKMTLASLFFADTDLTSGNIASDDEFIVRGLARNEDEFFRVTGKEFLPLWHAPHYKANSKIREAGALSGYKYIDAICKSKSIFGTTEDAENAMEKMLSAIETDGVNAVAVTVGSILNLDYLIVSLLDAGYEITGAEEL